MTRGRASKESPIMASPRTGRDQLPPDPAERVAILLAQAIHDVEHERMKDVPVVHFWDTDSLFVPARGALELIRPEERKQNAEDKLAKTLFSAGVLGTVSLLRPHRAEFLRAVASWQADRSGTVMSPAQISQFLNKTDLSQVKRVSRYLLDRPEFTGEVLEEAVTQLRSLDRDAFVRIESLAGTWQVRTENLVNEERLILGKRSGGHT